MNFTALLQMRRSSLKIKFTPEEDARLVQLVRQYGTKDWTNIAIHMGTRNPRQCRERWSNYVNPNLRTDPWTEEEDALLEEKFKEFGGKWNKIAKFFTNRSDNSLRNRWMMIVRRKSKPNIASFSPPNTPASVEATTVAANRRTIEGQTVTETPTVEIRPYEGSVDMFDFAADCLAVFGNGDEWTTF